MSDKKMGWLPEDKVEDTRPPPPYTPGSGSGYDTGALQQSPKSLCSAYRQHDDAKVQQQGKCMTSKGSSSTWWRRALRRVPVSSHWALRQQVHNSNMHLAAAPTTAKGGGRPFSVMDLQILPRWNGHNGMTCGQGAMLPEGAARWQQARLSFSSDYLPELLRGPPIPWRANLDDCCQDDELCFVNYPYPVPFFTGQPESGKVKAYYHNDTATLSSGMSVSVGGHTYERTIQLSLQRDRRDSCYWSFALSLTSRDGDWLANLSRADAAALVGLDSAIR
ncbi:hypothetical protein B0T19DRAFT_484108 [Cercophora scortea]|uniref:Uncharacterized protein n=1 Tax=Cercophora scortea TaxID=314031 RepID=A0AAE0IZJ4_9PEZI|nr:hypothetical protein B0T19DRAFT_484108 [Cercophora scortea]